MEQIKPEEHEEEEEEEACSTFSQFISKFNINNHIHHKHLKLNTKTKPHKQYKQDLLFVFLMKKRE